MIFYAYFFCCLSQNNYLCTLIFSLLLNMLSHPTWVRGLKLRGRREHRGRKRKDAGNVESTEAIK